MPLLSWPRMRVFLSVMSLPGMVLPAGAKTPFMPARALGAPQTTLSSSADLHAVASLAADEGFFERHVVARNGASGRREDAFHAGARIGRAADDFEQLCRSSCRCFPGRG